MTTGRSKVLIVEDEADVRELMLLHLKREGFDVESVESAEDASAKIGREKFDLIVLDWMLPGMSGLELCKRIAGGAPVLMVTARADTSDVVLGLGMGADDYVTKPFEIPIFLARVRALLRRAVLAREPDSGRIRVGDLTMDLQAHQLICAGREVLLTASEFKLLAALLRNRGRVLSRERLIDLVQGHGVSVVDRAIDTHVFGLRKKLGTCADIIETIRGVGYRVIAE